MKKIFWVCLFSLLMQSFFLVPAWAKESVNQDVWKSDDIHLLARVIHGEARGESYLGKLAVGAVIMNRLKSPLFPDNLEDVIYQPKAFTCVEDGQINLEADQESYRAALDAIGGIDPTNGCLFYYNPKTATSRWMHNRTSEYRETIGNHVFMK